MTLRLRELRLANYRSFPRAALSLGDLTALVGPNSSGKSTLLDALSFLRESVTDSLPVALPSACSCPSSRTCASTFPCFPCMAA